MKNQGTGLGASIPKIKIHYNHKNVYIYNMRKFMYSNLIALKIYVYVVIL